MPGPLDTLNELRDKLGDLPARVVDALQQAEPPAPSQGESFPMAAAEATTEALRGLSAEVPQTAASWDAPVAAPYEGGAAAVSPYESTDSSSPSMAGYEPPSISPDSGANLGMTPAAATGNDFAPAPAGRSDNGEVLSLLRELLDSKGGNGGGGRQERQPVPSGRRVTWQSSFSAPPQEGFAEGASPSMNLSNTAGVSGASSTRGFGTSRGRGRYWQPDEEGGMPR